MYDDEDDEYSYEAPVRRFRRIDLLLVALALPRALFQTVADWLEETLELAAAHSNWTARQEQPVKVTP